MSRRGFVALATALAIGAGVTACGTTEPPPPPPAKTETETLATTTARHAAQAEQRWAAIAARIDPHVDKPRVMVMTDIANEPDDQMSMVRLLVYSNTLDIEGLVATTSTWMRATVRPDVLHTVIAAYAQARPHLEAQAPGYPTADALDALVVKGQEGYGMAVVGADRLSPGAEAIIKAVDRKDPRPLWVLAWGGTNTLAQALFHVRRTRPTPELDAFVAKLRVYAISDQDDAGPWLRRVFVNLHYIAIPSSQDGDEYYRATWTGISGDRFYRNANGADFTTFTDAWVQANIRSHGPLGTLYIRPCCIHEGDTPSFLGLLDNGLGSAMSPTYGGWGGRYVWRQPSGESRPFWTQGGDSYPGRDSSRDTVIGTDGQAHTTDQATIWRWRDAFQRDFAARMAWASGRGSNHNPRIIVNTESGTAPLTLIAPVGTPVLLDATGTTDPDGHALTYRWFFYPEAGTGIPGQPVLAARPRVGGGGDAAAGGIPSAPDGGPPQPPVRVKLAAATASRAAATLLVPGVAHVILEVTDNGTPNLTSYRRVILRSPGSTSQ
ncbi:MAG: nucleoside hydrolase-like domain-containing protein [Vicinamibacteraceae bacterium]